MLRALQGFVQQPCAENDPPLRNLDEIEQDVAHQLSNLLEEYHERKSSGTQATSIPRFFRPKPAVGTLPALLKTAARRRKEEFQTELRLSAEELQQVYFLLDTFAEHGKDGNSNDPRINYDGFCQAATRCREMFGPNIDVYFKAPVFLRFEQDKDGGISIAHFTTYLSKRSSMHEMRVLLSPFDPDITGVLNEQQLERYIGAQVAEAMVMLDMEPSFEQRYQRIAARKFLFFHGSNATIALKDLVNSPVLRELRELATLEVGDPHLMDNWVSLQSTQRVFNTFENLDTDMNGMLSRSEFSQISSDSMSPFFVSRIFEVHVMQARAMMRRQSTRDEMDLVSFTDFVLAWDHRNHPAAIKYFFDIFDLKKQGFISPAELYAFFSVIHQMWVAIGEYADLSIYDVVDELLDMVNPKVSCRITPADLAASCQSGVFFSILSDVRQFQEYNYRENNLHSNDDDNQ